MPTAPEPMRRPPIRSRALRELLGSSLASQTILFLTRKNGSNATFNPFECSALAVLQIDAANFGFHGSRFAERG